MTDWEILEAAAEKIRKRGFDSHPAELAARIDAGEMTHSEVREFVEGGA